MKLLLKCLAWIVGILIAAYIIIAFTLHILIKPDTYKHYLSQVIYKHTGHVVQFNGALSFTFFPAPGLHLTDVIVSNVHPADQKLAPYTAKIGAADIHIRLIPLITGKVIPKNIILKSATLNLIHGHTPMPTTTQIVQLQLPKGVSNTRNHPQNRQNKKQGPQTFSLNTLQKMNLPTITVQNTTVNWINLDNQHITSLKNLNLRLSPSHHNQAATVRAHFTLLQAHLKKQTEYQLKAQLYDREETIQIKNLAISANITTAKHPASMLTLKAKAIRINLPKQMVTVPHYAGRYNTLTFQGQLQDHWKNADKAVTNTLLSDTQLASGRIRENNRLTRYDSGTIAIESTLSVKNVELAPLFKGLTNTEKLAGTLNLNAKLQTKFLHPNTALNHLSGTADISLSNTSIQAVNLLTYFNKALSLLNRKPVANTPAKTALFQKLSGHFNVQAGVANNQDLQLLSKRFTGTGKGSIDLVNQMIDYRIVLHPTKNQRFQIPLTIKGPWKHPKIRTDLKQMGTGLIEHLLQQRSKGFFHQKHFRLKDLWQR